MVSVQHRGGGEVKQWIIITLIGLALALACYKLLSIADIKLLGTFLIECGQNFIPVVSTIIMLIAGAGIFATGIWFGRAIK